MATPQYPTTLPIPKAVQGSPSNQLLSGSDDGQYSARRLTMVPAASISATFKFLQNQYQQFVFWYRVDLKYGHKWFTINLPSGAGIVPHVARFMSPPEAKFNGHRHWDVTADFEIRERQF